MALQSRKSEPVVDENLSNWKLIGRGGFGRVYKVRHKVWRVDVAIKILHTGVCYKEANLMETVSSEFVLRVYGIYQGCPLSSGSMQDGIVMPFMSRGSVESLQKHLSGPPPWPLAFRLAHQVALGVNFLHLNGIVHKDLKPGNVLLTENLDARLADFGLSRVSTSAVTSSREKTGESGGTYKYMPPEAFNVSYKPVRSFDIYSYGILLWSIVSGKEPYPGRSELVELNIPDGERPLCGDLEKMEVEVEGLKELVDLMKRCWDQDPDKRPKFYNENKPDDSEVLKETEEMFSKHKKDIHDAVSQVIKRLDSPTGNQRPESVSNRRPPPQTQEQSVSNNEVNKLASPITRHPQTQDSPTGNQRSETSGSNRRPPPQAPERSMPVDEVDMPSPITRTPPTQDASRSSAKHMTDEEKKKFVNAKRTALIQNVTLVLAIADELGNMVNRETYANIKAEKTPHKQMRELYTSVLDSGVKKVNVAFYNALKIHHSDLVEELGGF